MVGYLNELGKYCSLSVIFEKECDLTRPENWKNLLDNTNFESTVLTGCSINQRIYGDKMDSAPDDKALSLSVIKYIQKSYDFIIVANPCTPTGIVAIGYMRLMRIPYSIQSEGGYPGSGKGFKEKLKYWLMSRAEYYFSTCDMDDAYFIQYGARKDYIRRYPFASINERNLPQSYIDGRERDEYKKALDINYKKMILAVGRSVYVKGFDVLLRAIWGMPDDVCTYFVGGECKEEYKKIIEDKQLKNVFFIDNLEQGELARYYSAADVFVLPTRNDTWGLVINEAMTYGLPVITTNKCVAGDALIQDGTNGYIVESENVEALHDKICLLLNNDELMLRMGYTNYNRMRNWTFEAMGKIMYDHIVTIVKENNNDY